MILVNPILLALLAFSADGAAFSTPSSKPTTVAKRSWTGRSRLAMVDQDGASIPSVKKQIVYDEKTGRFFESNKDAGDCIPDEEFCVVDKDSGAMIRLTVEEKERIFLDALQVSGQLCHTQFSGSRTRLPSCGSD